MLIIISTPIGNLADLSFRALDELKKADLILCEDQRRSKILCDHYQISTPLAPFHRFNERAREERILEELKQGKEIALVCDAGTPTIQDPAAHLIRRCQEEKIPYTALPGPCALIDALVLSGLEWDTFQFLGFLPHAKESARLKLVEALLYPGVTLIYEAPTRLLRALHLIHQFAPQRPLAVARELTKQYEEVVGGPPAKLIDHFTAREPRGEFVLMVGAPTREENLWRRQSPTELVATLQEHYQLEKRIALKLAAELSGQSKKIFYREIHQLNDHSSDASDG